MSHRQSYRHALHNGCTVYIMKGLLCLIQVSNNCVFNHLCHAFSRKRHYTARHRSERIYDSHKLCVILWVVCQFTIGKCNAKFLIKLFQCGQSFLQKRIVVFIIRINTENFREITIKNRFIYTGTVDFF